jgi:hypothetical protein
MKDMWACRSRVTQSDAAVALAAALKGAIGGGDERRAAEQCGMFATWHQKNLCEYWPSTSAAAT